MVIRHPHTAGNDGGGASMNGWTDVPLTARGEAEARLVAERLSSLPRATPVYSSPLTRARAVAELVAAEGLGPPTFDPDLREIGCGSVDGWSVERVRRAVPILWRRNELQDDDDFRWPEGESCREFRSRCMGAFGRIAARHPGELVVVVTHAGVVSQLLGAIAGTRPARWDAFRPGNASITTVEWRETGARLVAFDDRGHLVSRAARVG